MEKFLFYRSSHGESSIIRYKGLESMALSIDDEEYSIPKVTLERIH